MTKDYFDQGLQVASDTMDRVQHIPGARLISQLNLAGDGIHTVKGLNEENLRQTSASVNSGASHGFSFAAGLLAAEEATPLCGAAAGATTATVAGAPLAPVVFGVCEVSAGAIAGYGASLVLKHSGVQQTSYYKTALNALCEKLIDIKHEGGELVDYLTGLHHAAPQPQPHTPAHPAGHVPGPSPMLVAGEDKPSVRHT